MRVRNDRIDLNVIAAHLEVAKTVGANGASFSGLVLEDSLAVLDSALEFSERVSDTERVRILADSVFDAGRTGTITRKSLMAAVGRHEAAYLAKPRTRHVLLTSLSIRFGEHLRPLRLGDAALTFGPFVPKRFDRSPLSTIPGFPEEPDPWGYAIVRVSVPARSIFEAFAIAMGVLDEVRGVWAFSLSRGTLSPWFSGGRPQPVGPVRLGRCHSIHKPDGKVFEGSFWYPTTDDVREPIDVRREWPRIDREYRLIRQALRKCKYGTQLTDVFRRYARALDGTDFGTTFLGLWALLEVLTATGSRYDHTIERVLFSQSEREVSRAVLEHLRDYRNATVHESHSKGQVESYVFQLKRYVDVLLRLHVAWAGSFDSIAEVGEFLALPHDPSVLRIRIKKLERALKFRGR